MIEIRNLAFAYGRESVLRDVSFEAYGGEILGFSGLVGAGRTETMRAIFGADKFESAEF